MREKKEAWFKEKVVKLKKLIKLIAKVYCKKIGSTKKEKTN